VIRNHTAVTEVLMSDHGKVQKVLQPL